MMSKMQYRPQNGLQHKISDENIRIELGLIDFVVGEQEEYCENSKEIKTIYVKDFGAKGDGIANDSSAIRKAITVLRHLPKGSTLVFEPNTTYYVSSGKYAVDLRELHGVNICGDNTTILVKPIMSLCRIKDCSNITVKGLTFDYKTKPYAIADVTNVFRDGVIRIKTNKSLNIRGTYKQPVPDYFGLVDRDDGRYHVGITTYKVVNHEQNIYDVKCNNIFAQRDKRIKMMKDEKYRFIVPMPHVGQVIEQAITMVCNENVSMIDCNICCAAKFMFYIKANRGFIFFKNVNVEPAQGDSDMPIVGWRDGFYCRDNRAKLVLEDCKVDLLCDDILNISASVLQVQQVNDGLISLYRQEKGLPYDGVEIGDEITFFNVDTGEMLGKSIISSVDVYDAHIDVRLETEIAGICSLPSCKAVVNNLASPNSVIRNCNFRGTFRFRAPLYVKESTIHITRMWIDAEIPTEGPIANNILFSNCALSFDDDMNKYIHVDSKNKKWKNAENPYRVENIVFYNCDVRKDAVQYGEVEEKYRAVRFIESDN